MTTRTLRFNVVAPSAGVPSWASGATLNQWVAIQGTQLAGTGKPFCSWPFGTPPSTTGFVRYSGTGGSIGNTLVFAYSGCAFDQANSTVWSAANGGHDDYYGNEVYKLDLRSETPAWVLVRIPTQNVTVENAATRGPGQNGYNTFDGRPVSRHSYWCPWYDRYTNKVFLLGAIACQGIADGYRNVDAFNPATGDWDVIAGITHEPVASAAFDTNGPSGFMDADGDVYLLNGGASPYGAARFNLSGAKAAQRTWTTVKASGMNFNYNTAVVFNSNSGVAFMPRHYGFGQYFPSKVFSLPSLNETYPTLSGSGLAAYDAALLAGNRTAAAFDPVANAYIVMPWNQPKTFKIDATTYTVTEIGTMPNVGGGVGQVFRAFGNFTYSTFLGGVVFVTEERTANVHFLRTH